MNSLLSEWEAHQVFVLEEKNQKAGHLKYLSEIKCLPVLIYLKPLSLIVCLPEIWPL